MHEPKLRLGSTSGRGPLLERMQTGFLETFRNITTELVEKNFRILLVLSNTSPDE